MIRLTCGGLQRALSQQAIPTAIGHDGWSALLVVMAIDLAASLAVDSVTSNLQPAGILWRIGGEALKASVPPGWYSFGMFAIILWMPSKPWLVPALA